jgi:hypothetical protein
MTIQSVYGPTPATIVKPICEQSVPTGFVDALVQARKFTGRANKVFPWVQDIYLSEGKLYASDNRCIIEIDLGDPSFGPARFSAGDVSVLRAMGSNPQRAKFDDSGAAFTWNGGQWCIFRGEQKGYELVDTARMLLGQLWQMGRKVSTDTRSAILKAARVREASDVGCFKASTTGFANDQHWHRGAIAKVMTAAEDFSPGSITSSFTFPNGRGLLVKPSTHTIGK